MNMFSPPTACLATSNTMKTSQQRESFLVSFRLISLYPEAQFCAFFSNRVLPSTYGKNNDTAYAVFETSGASVTNKS